MLVSFSLTVILLYSLRIAVVCLFFIIISFELKLTSHGSNPISLLFIMSINHSVDSTSKPNIVNGHSAVFSLDDSEADSTWKSVLSSDHGDINSTGTSSQDQKHLSDINKSWHPYGGHGPTTSNGYTSGYLEQEHHKVNSQQHNSIQSSLLPIPAKSEPSSPLSPSHMRNESDATLNSGDQFAKMDRGLNPSLSDLDLSIDSKSFISQSSIPQQQYNGSKIVSKLKSVLRTVFLSRPGITLSLLSQVTGSIMAAITRKLEIATQPKLHPLQILFVRQAITWTLSIAYMHYHQVPNYLIGPKGYRLWLLSRGVMGFCGVFGLYYALMYLTLSDSTVISFLNPTIVGFMAWIILGEVFTKLEMYGGLISLVGVVIIARPSFLIGASSDHVDKKTGVTGAQRSTAVLSAFLGVVSAAIAMISIRKVGHNAHPLVSVSIFALSCIIVSLVGMLAIPDIGFLIPNNLEQWGLLIALGIAGFLTQFLSTAAIQREKAAVVAGLGYLGILWAMLWERVFFNNLPDVWSFVGGSIILGSAGYVAFNKIYGTDQAEGDFEDNSVQYHILDPNQRLSLDGNELDDLDTTLTSSNLSSPVISSTHHQAFDV